MRGLSTWNNAAGIVSAVAAVAALLFAFGGGSGSCEDAIDWRSAESHQGETVTVSGPVMSATYATDLRAKPTYLNLGNAFPEPDRLTVVIFEDDRDNFTSPPEDAFEGKEVAVSGEVTTFRGASQIVANHENDIEVC